MLSYKLTFICEEPEKAGAPLQGHMKFIVIISFEILVLQLDNI